MEPVDIVGVVFVILGIVFYLALGIRLYKSYKVSEKKQTLYLSLLLIFGGMALLSLTLEQVILLVNADPLDSQTVDDALSILQHSEIDVFWVAFIFATIARLTSSIAIIAANYFTQSFFPESNKKLLLIPIVLMIAFWLLVTFSPFYFEYVEGDWSPNNDASTTFLTWILFLIPLWSISILFLYLSVSLKRKGVIAWRRVGWFFMSQVILSIGFTIEILNPGTITTFFDNLNINIDLLLNKAFWAVSSRFMVMIYPILMWVAVYTPDWAKGFLGVS
jgi:hypothetical protein